MDITAFGALEEYLKTIRDLVVNKGFSFTLEIENDVKDVTDVRLHEAITNGEPLPEYKQYEQCGLKTLTLTVKRGY